MAADREGVAGGAWDWGEVELSGGVTDAGDGARGLGPFRRSVYLWRPPADVASHLPDGFALAFDCFAARDGVRRFAPADGLAAFLPKAALAGYAVLRARASPDPEHRFSYHAARLLHRLAPGLREHLDRTFARESDLYVPEAGRVVADDRHVLPAALGLDARGRGTPWSPRQLMEAGRAAAGDDPDPDPAACIRRGLYAAARLDPIDPAALPPDQALGLVRLALFDLGPSDARPDEAVLDRVQERLWRAVERHIDSSTDDFNVWFFENVDNVVHAIAKQRRGGGPIARAVVRQSILELVFRVHAHAGGCVHRVMAAFARALPGPLTDAERPHFNTLYRAQPHFGGLPLALLHARFGFLREAVLDVLENPGDAGPVGALLRLLAYYGEMVGRRRAADRRYKARAHARNDQARAAATVAADPARAAASAAARSPDWFLRIVIALRGDEAACPCGTAEHWRATLGCGVTADPIVFEVRCEACAWHETVETSRERFAEVGNRTGTAP